MRRPAAGVVSLGCPLCGLPDPALYFQGDSQDYRRCRRCVLIFVPPGQRLDPVAERARYDLHQNDVADPRYRAFLSRLMEPLLERVPPGAEGLDFGCGPGPALAAMLTERGRPTACYDPYYAPDESIWKRPYAFIAASEVVEHLYHPARELDRLFGVLQSGGWLGIMTKPPPADLGAFATWHYRREPTHVAFYSRPTFEYVAAHWGGAAVFAGTDVVLIRKV
jgi:hypothetical protein